MKPFSNDPTNQEFDFKSHGARAITSNMQWQGQNQCMPMAAARISKSSKIRYNSNGQQSHHPQSLNWNGEQADERVVRVKDSIMGRTMTMGTFDNSQWKSFINFERKNHQF